MNSQAGQNGELNRDGTDNIWQASQIGSLAGVKYWHAQDPSTIHQKRASYLNRTPLHLSSLNGHLDIVKFLLAQGVEVDPEDYIKSTPLMKASLNGHVDIVNALLDKGANLRLQDGFKNTPLHYAVDAIQLPVIKVLVARGADTKILNKWKQTPLEYAKELGGRSAIVEYLSSL